MARRGTSIRPRKSKAITAKQKAARRKNIAIARKARKTRARADAAAKKRKTDKKKGNWGKKKSRSSNWLDNMESRAKKVFKRKQKYDFKGRPISQKKWEEFNK